MKKLAITAFALVLMVSVLTGCGCTNSAAPAPTAKSDSCGNIYGRGRFSDSALLVCKNQNFASAIAAMHICGLSIKIHAVASQ